MTEVYDCVIIGAGLSGLNTAYQLLKKNRKMKIMLVEKNDMIGGRVKSINLHHEHNYEAGSIRFYPSHKKMLSLLKEFKITKKDFYVIPQDMKINYALTQKRFQKIKETDLELYSLLLDEKNINLIPESKRLSITLEEYAILVLGKAKLEYLKVLNAFSHIFQTSMKYGLYLLERDFVKVKEYYIIKTMTLTDFLYLILEKMTKMSLQLNLSEEFVSYQMKNNSNLIEVKTNHQKYLTKNLVITLPPLQLQKIKSIPKMLVNTTIPVPLCRMFAIYPANNFWYRDISATYTNENVQRIYLKGTRLVQISYTSAEKAEFWNQLSKNQMKMKIELQKELRRMFPKKEIHHPEVLNTHYWEAGVHLWKPKVEGDIVTETIIKPFPHKNVYICNEAYSKQQRWMEGALEMSQRVVNLILKK